MNKLPRDDDVIDIDSLRKLCKVCYDGQDDFEEPPPGIVFLHAHWVDKFLSKFKRNRYVLVSGASDSCVCPVGGIGPYAPNYRHAMGPLVGRLYQTLFALNGLPPNVVRWYTANCAVYHERIRWAPFGLNTNTEPLSSLRDTPKDGLLYVNFQNHTGERTWLKQYFFSDKPWATVRPYANLPGPEFRREIARHKFVLCTHGMGFDCHRTYETLYAGSYPVMLRNAFSKRLAQTHMPILLVESYDILTPEHLEKVYGNFRNIGWDYSKISLSYWKNELARAGELC